MSARQLFMSHTKRSSGRRWRPPSMTAFGLDRWFTNSQIQVNQADSLPKRYRDNPASSVQRTQTCVRSIRMCGLCLATAARAAARREALRKCCVHLQATRTGS